MTLEEAAAAVSRALKAVSKNVGAVGHVGMCNIRSLFKHGVYPDHRMLQKRTPKNGWKTCFGDFWVRALFADCYVLDGFHGERSR